jgi:hypothetical protein
MVSWNGVDIASGEKPEIAIRMPDGQIRDTVWERISPMGRDTSNHTRSKSTRSKSPRSKSTRSKSPSKQKLVRQGPSYKPVVINTIKPEVFRSEPHRLSMDDSKLRKQKARKEAREIIRKLREKQKKEKKREEAREIVRKLREKQKRIN